MLARILICSLTGVCLISASATAEQPGPGGDLAKLPIREITIFKDGHAFVLHEGETPTNEIGDIVLDYLPAPVLGTYWAYSGEKDAPLRAVVAARRDETVMRTATNLIELLQANLGRTVTITDTRNEIFTGIVVALPRKELESESRLVQVRGPRPAPQQPELLLLRGESGLKAINAREVSR